ncbi:MAG TPA: CHASE2 domain-containing protein, partial [Myxococcaceae bacterium]|nr:CHASE2 domain-containing protein [Myxococcaceae bacterium]
MRRLSGRALTAAILAAGAVALSTVADRLGAFERLELVLYDALLTRFRAHQPRSEDVAILAVDDLTLQGISAKHRMQFGTWPYSRNFWAILVRYLHAAGARALIFDMAMDEPSQNAADDDAFAKAVAESELPTYLGFVTRPLSAEEEQAGVAPKRGAAKNRLDVGRFQPLEVADDAFG